jgi:hypothetical protein
VAGVQASPLARLPAEKTGVETDRAGRIPVNPDCTVPGHPEVFAIGDMVSLNRLPGVAQPPQQGKYVARVITARLRGEPAPPPFKYFGNHLSRRHATTSPKTGRRRPPQAHPAWHHPGHELHGYRPTAQRRPRRMSRGHPTNR